MKNKNVRLKLWGLFGVFVLISIFILLSYLVQTNFEFFENMIVGNSLGLIVYMLLNVIGIVVAPVTVIPLIVVVAGIWGPVVAGFSTLIAWVFGSVIAFLIARKFGVPVARRFVSLDKLYKLEDRFSILGSFWGIVFLRMVVPIEVLSYGLGLFSRIGFWKYTFASVLGLIPVSFAFAYLGMIPFVYQVILGLVILINLLVFMIFVEIKER